jgi:hypothetical protein
MGSAERIEEVGRALAQAADDYRRSVERLRVGLPERKKKQEQQSAEIARLQRISSSVEEKRGL